MLEVVEKQMKVTCMIMTMFIWTNQIAASCQQENLQPEGEGVQEVQGEVQGEATGAVVMLIMEEEAIGVEVKVTEQEGGPVQREMNGERVQLEEIPIEQNGQGVKMHIVLSFSLICFCNIKRNYICKHCNRGVNSMDQTGIRTEGPSGATT